MRAFLLILIAMLALTLSMDQLYAKRFGGGRSFGVSRSINSTSQRSNMMNTMKQKVGNRWMAPMLGLLAGGLIGSLLWNHGLGAGLISWLVIGFVIYLILNLFRNRNVSRQDHLNYQTQTNANYNGSPFQNILSKLDPRGSETLTSNATMTENEELLRQFKVVFLRLQAAYDRKDLGDIRHYTTPEVLAEIQMQLQERGNAENHTEVTQLNADLLERTTEDLHELVSVRFSGMIKEDLNDAPHAFEEIWHFQAKAGNNEWFVAGIQQN